MIRARTPYIGRRAATLRIVTAGASLLLPGGPGLRAESRHGSPEQTEGPFYPVDWGGDADNDLVIVKGEAAKAMGHVTHITGRVMNLRGEGVPGATVEIWQCDARGIYRHPRDNALRRQPDRQFQSRGRAVTTPNGSYSFRTIRPVSYPGRTPHIHFKVYPPAGATLTTQMYVFGEAENERDFLLQELDARQRDSVIIRLDPADRIEGGALAGVFDIVLT